MTRRGTERLQKLAHVLDDAIRIPGTNIRFGIDPLLGLLPGGGDVAGGALSIYTIITAHRLGAPPVVIMRMAGNIMLDALLGVVPLLGDLFDVAWKSNRRNVALLERYLDAPEPVHTRSRLVVAGALVLVLAGLIGTAVISVAVVRWILNVLF